MPDRIYQRWRWQIFIITWLAYAGFYFTRKSFAVAKIGLAKDPSVHMNDVQMGAIDGANLAVAFRQPTSSDDTAVGDGSLGHVRARRSVAARVNNSCVTVPASRNRLPSGRYGVSSNPTGPTLDTVPTSVS